MNNQIKKAITSKVASLLYNEYKDHQTMKTWGGDWRWKKIYLKKVGYSLMNYALYGMCVMAPEHRFEYLEWRAKDYQEPKVKYKGVLGINPEDERDMADMDLILREQLHDNKLEVRKTINEIINIIISLGTQN